MRILFLTLIIVSCLTLSCFKRAIDKFEIYYEVISELEKLQILDSNSILVLELITMVENPVETTISTSDSKLTTIYLHPPPIPNASKISRQFLRNLSLNGIITNTDIEYLFNQIKIMNSISLNQTKINSKTISYKLIETILTQDKSPNVFRILGKEHGVDSYILLSSPLVTQDGETIIFDMIKYSLDNCKSGIRYIFEKHQHTWRIIYATPICVG